ncbi:hypothetical protein TWF696_007924 [Orbilia brochopaga]|uniref:GAR domain-containing protein n=1 Tax=Orbilia brochopaga TaxID=3140254 RepID=A0AAV9UR35_9PEZI
MASPSPPRPPPIQTALASPRRPRPPPNPPSSTATVLRTPRSAASSTSPSARRAQQDPLLSRLTPSAITKMSDLDFLPGEKEVGVRAATAAEKIDVWLREVETWEELTFWSKTNGDGFRIPEDSKQRKKRRRIDLSASAAVTSPAVSKHSPVKPVARRLFSDPTGASSGGPSVAALKLDMKTKDAISMSEIDELLSPTTTPLFVKRLDFDLGMGMNSPMTPSRMHSGRPSSPFDKPFKRRSLQVASFGGNGSITPTPLKRQTFDFTPGHKPTPSPTKQTFRPSSSPSKPEQQPPLPSTDSNPAFLAVQPLSSAATSRSQSPSPSPLPVTDSETDAPTSDSDSTSDSDLPSDADEFLGSLPGPVLTCISDRVGSISADLAQLDIEGLKSRVLEFKAQQIDEHGNGRMSDSLAIITATTLQLLPPLHRLWHLLETWGWRVDVCRVVPTFLTNLDCAEGIVMRGDDDGARWLEEIEEGVAADAIVESTLATLENGVDEMWEQRRSEAFDRIKLCAGIVDGMLDLLDGREETIPDEWIDRVDALEEAMDSWVVKEVERADVLKRRWRELIRRRKEDEEQRRRAERERLRREEEERRRRQEEEERARRQAEEERKRKEEEERLRLEEEERVRRAEEEALRKAEEEARRLREAEEERVRLAEAERLRLEEVERLRKAEQEAARLRREAEEEAARQAEAERLRLEKEREAEEEETRQAEAERLRLEKEREEQLRLAEETRRQQALAEEELARRLAEEEAQRRAAELARIHELEERQRLKYEALERAEEEARAKALLEQAGSEDPLAVEVDDSEAVAESDLPLGTEEAVEDVSSPAAQVEDVVSEALAVPTDSSIAPKPKEPVAEVASLDAEAVDLDSTTILEPEEEEEPEPIIEEASLPAPLQPEVDENLTTEPILHPPTSPDILPRDTEIYNDDSVVEILPSISETLETEESEVEMEEVEDNTAFSTQILTDNTAGELSEPADSDLALQIPLQLQPALSPIAEEGRSPVLGITRTDDADELLRNLETVMPEFDLEEESILVEPPTTLEREADPLDLTTPEETPFDQPVSSTTNDDDTHFQPLEDPTIQSQDALPSENDLAVPEPSLDRSLVDPEDSLSTPPTLLIDVINPPITVATPLSAGTIVPPSPPVPTIETKLPETTEDAFAVSPLLTPATLVEEPTDLSPHLHESGDSGRPISPAPKLPEPVPVVTIHAAVPTETIKTSPVENAPADNLPILHEAGKVSPSDVRVVISEDAGASDAQILEEPQGNQAVDTPRRVSPVLGQSTASTLNRLPTSPEPPAPSIVYNGLEVSESPRSPEKRKAQRSDVRKVHTTTLVSQPSPSPSLSPAVPGLADEYVSDIDDSDVETVADDEEFQAELRKERFGDDSGYRLGSKDPLSNDTVGMGRGLAAPAVGQLSPSKSKKLQGDSNGSKSPASRNGAMNNASTNAAVSPQVTRGGLKLASPFHLNTRNALDASSQRHDSFDSIMSNGLPDQSFNSVQSIEIARGIASPLSPTGSVIHHSIDESFGASFNSIHSDDTIPDAAAVVLDDAVDAVIEDPDVVLVEEDEEPDTIAIEDDDEVSPIKEFDDSMFRYSVSGGSPTKRSGSPSKPRRDESPVAVKRAAPAIVKVRKPSRGQNDAGFSTSQVRDAPVYVPIAPPLTAVLQQPKRRQSSVSSVSNFTSGAGSKAPEPVARPARPQSQLAHNVRRVSSIPTIALPKTQAQKDAGTRADRSRSHSHRYSSATISVSHREDTPPAQGHSRPDSRAAAIPRKTSSSHIPMPVQVPKRSSSFEKTGEAALKKRSSASGTFARDRDVTPKPSAAETRNAPSRSSSRMGSSSSLRSQSSRQILRSAPSPRSPTDAEFRRQSSRMSMRGTAGPHPRQSDPQLSSQSRSHSRSNSQSQSQSHTNNTTSSGYGQDSGIKVVKRKNNLISKQQARASAADRGSGAMSPVSPIDFPSLRPVLNPPSTPMQGKELEDRLEKKINKILIGLPSLTMTPSPMKKPPPPPINTAAEPPIKQPRFGESKLPIARQPSTPTIGQAPNLTLVSKRTISQPGEVKMYHLHKSDDESPVKLFVRLVGDGGERVMVRVGGGWADLKEYLIEYAAHHGIQGSRRMPNDSIVEFGDDSRSIRASGSNSSLRSSFRGSPTPTFSNSNNSRPGSPLVGGAKPPVPTRAESPFFNRRPESPRPGQMGTSPGVRLGLQSTAHSRGSPGTPSYERPVTPGGSAGFHSLYTSPSYGSGLVVNPKRPMSRLSFGDFADAESPSSPVSSVPLGLAGPKSRNVEISAEKQAWVDGMLGQVRKASAERNVRMGLPRMGSSSNLHGAAAEDDAASTGSAGGGPRLTDMGKVGSTRRMYVTKQPSYLGLRGAKSSSSSLRLSDAGREERGSGRGS